jgi:hypothetical protein
VFRRPGFSQVLGAYRITLLDDPGYEVGSADNVRSYDREHDLDNARGVYLTSCHALRVSKNERLIASCILLASRGPSGIHENSAIIHNDSCIIAVGAYMVSVHIPTLELQWATESDAATCFGVYHSEKHQCFISHGELEIARVSLDGQIIWRSGGADIFTNGFTLHNDYVNVLDWNHKEYNFDIEFGREYSAQ